MLTFVLDPVPVPRAFIGLVVRSCVEGKDRRGDHLRLVNKLRVKSKASGLEPARQEPADQDKGRTRELVLPDHKATLPACTTNLWRPVVSERSDRSVYVPDEAFLAVCYL